MPSSTPQPRPVNMDIQIRAVSSKKDLKKFIYLPEKIHKDHHNWVPPLYQHEHHSYDPKKNLAFSYCKTILLLAYRGRQIVGRIMGIINTRHNQIHQSKTARFCCLETWQEKEVVDALLNHLETWARQNHMDKLIGPYGFTDLDPEGFLIEGYDNRATIGTYYNFEWMPTLVESNGYTKEIDYFVYKLKVPPRPSELHLRICERILQRDNFKVREFKSRRELKPWVRPVLQLMNQCYTNSNIYGYTPLGEAEMDDLAKRYFSFLDPKLLKLVTLDNQVVAFMIAIPDLTEGIQKAKGRLFPLGWLKIINAARKTNQLDLILGGIKEEFRNLGLDMLMVTRMIVSAQKAGFEIVDMHHEMETNIKMRAEVERFGGKLYKRYRIYQKQL